MADENPTPSAAPSDDPDKKETIRITLPPKGETPVAKRETVRVNLTDTAGITPKKETSKVTLPTSGSRLRRRSPAHRHRRSHGLPRRPRRRHFPSP